MSYCLEGDKSSSYGPTIQGMKLLRESVMTVSLKYPTLADFVLEGQTSKPEELAEECLKFINITDNESLKSTLQHLAKVASVNKKELRLC